MSIGGAGSSRRTVLGAMAAVASLPVTGGAAAAADARFDVHRFGVNYVPSGHWYYCWNDWSADAIARDFDAIAGLGADHIRIMLIWPWFQPNPTTVSTAHLDRLDQMMTLAAARRLDVLVTLYTGWLSGFAFKPHFLEKESFYTAPAWAKAQDLFLTQTAARAIRHPNFLGFDVGNEINCCWEATPAQGDPWMRRVLSTMHRLAPGRVHVNGVDHQPWFGANSFSPAALIAEQPMVAIHSWPFWTGAAKHGGPLSKPYTQLPAAMTALVRAHARDADKPVWLQEFGACTEEMTQAQIIPWMESAITGAVGQGVSWFTWWSSHDVDRRFELNSFEYDLGLLDSDNKLKPRGAAFRRIADAYRGKRVVRPRTLAAAPTQTGMDATWRWLLNWMAA